MKFLDTNRLGPVRGLPLALTLSASLLLAAVAQAQTSGRKTVTPAAPMSVLLFPAVMSSGAADLSGAPGAEAAPAARRAAAAEPDSTARQTEEMVTEAMRKYLAMSGVSVIVYDRRLPSIERAVAEGTLKLDDVAGPGDDPRKAQRLAELAGASEYLTAVIEDYKFDAATRTATLNLTLSRNSVAESASLGTAASPGTGVAPEDVARPRQEGSAAARAAETAAEQTVQRLFPPPPPPPTPDPKAALQRSSTGRKDGVLFGIVGGIFGLLVLTR